MTRPARIFAGHGPTRGSGRVGSGDVPILTGWVGSGQDVVEISKVSGRTLRCSTSNGSDRVTLTPPDHTRESPAIFGALLYIYDIEARHR